MAPEQEARERVLYDHESEEPRRHRRPAADWGVGEDIFDRMPSRRFKRGERRAEHQEIVIRRTGTGERHEVVEAEAAGYAGEVFDDPPARQADDAWEPRRGVVDEPAPRGGASRRVIAEWVDEAPRGGAAERGSRRPVESWLDDDERPMARGESRTIVLSNEPRPAALAEPPARRTVKISGHPDRLPAVRTPRPQHSALDRLGASPDRIAGYAVALGFLLVLIAVLTTGQ